MTEPKENPSFDLYAAGWRPAVGWVCVAALAYSYVLRPILSGLLRTPLPDLELNQIWALLLSMLGLSGLRTFEKIQKVV